VGDVEKAVVVVFVVVAVRGEVDVVDPDVLGDLDGDGVAADDFGYGEVAEDDVLYVFDGEGEIVEDFGVLGFCFVWLDGIDVPTELSLPMTDLLDPTFTFSPEPLMGPVIKTIAAASPLTALVKSASEATSTVFPPFPPVVPPFSVA